MLASGISFVNVRLSVGATGITTSELGAIPKVHSISAPMHTCIGIGNPLLGG